MDEVDKEHGLRKIFGLRAFVRVFQSERWRREREEETCSKKQQRETER